MNILLKSLEYLIENPAIVLTIGGVFWELVRRKDKRAGRIMEIAALVYGAVEGIAKREGINTVGKWNRFASLLVDSMKTNGLGEPSGKEMSIVRAWVTNMAHNGHK